MKYLIGGLLIAFSLFPVAACAGDKSSSDTEGEYHFALTRGKGIPVCEAYLARLNTTNFKHPPYCGRPENTSVNGFAKLTRVPLDAIDVRELYSILETFTGLGGKWQGRWPDMQVQQKLADAGQFKLSQAGVTSLQKDLDTGLSRIWRYQPPIDIDNDGKPDNIEVWAGDVLGNVRARKCGAEMGDLFSDGQPLRQPQLAFAVTAARDRLDVLKTRELFEHPLEGYPFFVDGKRSLGDEFRPVGKSIGIFKYRSLYYFDTFFDAWGDFAGKRRKDKNIANTLGVFLNKDGKTQQVCEYRMNKRSLPEAER